MNAAKRYLLQLRAINNRLLRLNEEIELKRSRMTSISIRYDKINVQSSAPTDPMADYAASVEENYKLLTKYQREYNRRRDVIEAQLLQLLDKDDRYGQILIGRYMDGLTWNQIAERMYMTRDTIIVYHGKALNMFAEMFGPFD